MLINRIDLIMKDIYENGSVSTKELAEKHAVSLDTIRRDLQTLEDSGKIEKVYGGATLPKLAHTALNYGSRKIANVDLKRQAAKKAVQEVKSKDLVAINAGTTNIFVAQALAYLNISMTVITNNHAVVETLYNNSLIDVIVVGGLLNKTEKSTYGDLCYSTFKKYHPDISFLTLNAIDLDAGLSDFREFEIPIIRVIAENSKKNFVVMDSSKFNKVSRKSVLNLKDIDTLYSDGNLESDTIKNFKEAGLIIK